jgi:hypothetical protein
MQEAGGNRLKAKERIRTKEVRRMVDESRPTGGGDPGQWNERLHGLAQAARRGEPKPLTRARYMELAHGAKLIVDKLTELGVSVDEGCTVRQIAEQLWPLL